MRLFVTGATGLIGRRLLPDRLARGDTVIALSRDAAKAQARFGDYRGDLRIIEGDPTQSGPWQADVEGCDAVINLAGAGIADRRWTDAYKRELESSRIESTRQVVGAMRLATARPRVLLNASAVGFYGDTGGERVDEAAAPGDDFLAGICLRWEREAERAATLGVREVRLRMAMVLDCLGGALPKLLIPFRLFLGGPIGSGRFTMPWVHWRDVVGLIDLVLSREETQGPMNIVSPEPVTNREFCRELGRALGRPSWLPVPRLAVRLVAGEVARSITMSQRVHPGRAESAGYAFEYPEIRAAMRSLLSQEEST